MYLIDFNNTKNNYKFYGGESGAKIGVIFENENWILKYPKSTKGLLHPKLSYTTSPLSEYIGSKIYETFNIPVQKTKLGFRDGKVIVACKDFEKKGTRLYEFKNIKNEYNFRTFDNGTSGSGTILSEVLLTIDTSEVLNKIYNIKERFWDMFVIDAYIGNQDRNNSNWGLLITEEEPIIMELAPVYDNGNAFYNKRDIDTFESRLKDTNLIKEDAVLTPISVYLKDNGHHIKPFEYMTESNNEELKKALIRFSEKVDHNIIDKIIEDIPNSDNGYKIISNPQKDFYKTILSYREKAIKSIIS